MRLSLLGLLSAFPFLTLAQNAGLPDPDIRCTLGLCRPIGEIMASCVGGDATPENIQWADVMAGPNTTVENQRSGNKLVMPARLQCFCSSPGLETRLNNCNGCYFRTNQEEYWTTGINNIKVVCGFADSNIGASSMVVTPSRRKLVSVAVGAVGMSIAIANLAA
ncbi:hypothetical protein BDZ91DRAFT_331224 [Kalaharituber pfeilii]|nr:hypothetical protein BDZ91DRAFT_331224 [Kalaharituber pfeilii]